MFRRVTLLVLLASFLCANFAHSQIKKIHPNARNPYVAVLMWHDVIKLAKGGEKEVWFDTTVTELKAQFEAIRRNRINVISMEALYKHLSEGSPLPPRPDGFDIRR